MRNAAARDEAALDSISAQLGEVLSRADALLADWSAFGRDVRAQVEREASAIGEVVASTIDRAALVATAATVERTLAGELAQRLSALGAELSRLESRTRAIARLAADERRRGHLLAWVAVAGIVLANVLLALVLFRGAHTGDAGARAPNAATAVIPDAGVIDATSPADAAATTDAIAPKPSLLHKIFPSVRGSTH